MPESYTIIENHIAKAIEALNSRKNAKLSTIAREFNVLEEDFVLGSKGCHLKRKYEDCIIDV